jgi:hypothetical protein
MFGTVTHDANRRLSDLTAREIAVLVPVVVFIVWIGIYPRPFLATTEASVKQLLAQVHVRYRAESRVPGAESREELTTTVKRHPKSVRGTERANLGLPVSKVAFEHSAIPIPQSAISGNGPRVTEGRRHGN